MEKRVRLRFAPSPTGGLHMGGVRTALFSYLFAKKHGGDFVLRIEDTDQTRYVNGAEEYIINSLKWCGIEPNEGVGFGDGPYAPYRQSERKELGIYKKYSDQLIASGHAYIAFDTAEDLERMNAIAKASGAKTGYNSFSRMSMKNSFTMSAEDVKSLLDSGHPHVIRFNVPRNTTVNFTDYVKGAISFDSNNLDDKVLFKSDGMAAYHLANVVDDHLMEITHVIRGDEWVSSTPLHIMLYEAFGWDKPEFCHMPLVLGPDGKKLSKRKMKEYGFTVFPLACNYVDDKGGTVDVLGFKDLGYDADAFINYLALLGWNPGNNKEFMTMDEMISLFTLERVTTQEQYLTSLS